MKTFNAIQMVILMLIAPTLLSLCKSATFVGASAVFWIGLVGFAALTVWNIILVRMGMGD